VRINLLLVALALAGMALAVSTSSTHLVRLGVTAIIVSVFALLVRYAHDRG
jgi:hypothetical protein